MLITHYRPMGYIAVAVQVNPDGGVKLMRSTRTEHSVLNVPFSYDKAVKDLTSWAAGALIQDACGDWDITWREWLITGIEPGDDLNPIFH